MSLKDTIELWKHLHEINLSHERSAAYVHDKIIVDTVNCLERVQKKEHQDELKRDHFKGELMRFWVFIGQRNKNYNEVVWKMCYKLVKKWEELGL